MDEFTERVSKGRGKPVRVSTCPTYAYGWDKKLHFAMPSIVQGLNAKGIAVHHSKSFNVDDWDLFILPEDV